MSTLHADSRCPGSGMRMISRTSTIRKIEPADRAENARRVERAEARGDPDEAQIIRDVFSEWERDQGQERDRLVCAVCGSAWLTPTASGTARPHRRYDVEQPSWDKARQIRKDIDALQAELGPAALPRRILAKAMALTSRP